MVREEPPQSIVRKWKQEGKSLWKIGDINE